MRIALAQLNPVVGDFDGNLRKIEKTLASLHADRPDLVVFPELFLTGYPPRDLLERTWFIEKAVVALARLADISKAHPAMGILAGTVMKSGHGVGKGLSNAAVLVRDGDLVAARPKSLLPSYDVFDETRYFDPAERVDVVGFGGETLGISICEDAWADESLWPRKVYDTDPIEELAQLEATVLVNIAASPFSVGKDEVRHGIFSGHAKRHGLPFVVVNQVGGNDELVFDGRSMVVGADGNLIAYLPAFEERVEVVDLAQPGRAIPFAPDDPVASVHDALVLGLRDYVRKCGFEKVVLGLSGGVDSAVVCAIAVAALGPTNVVGVTMPSPYSSTGSVEDSKALAANLGVRLETVPIESVCSSYLTALRPLFKETAIGIAEENIQARVRGNILMARVEQVRPSRALDGEQERAGGRLLHAVRRHERRALGHLGRAQDDGLWARAPREPREGAHPARDHREGRRRRSSSRTRRTRTRCRPTTCSTPSSTSTSRRGSRRRRS